ncbi:MAG: SDR family oxidoreductase [Clostridia bacterium]|nr:SDR family oxidoreductase [Clostridia bacterium]
MITEVKNLNAIITGASTGIGYAIAERFASLGINLAVCARSADKLDELKSKLSRYNVRVYTEAGDLTDVSFAEGFVKNAAQTLGGIDIIVNNAGIALSRSFEESTLEDYERIMSLNVRAPFVVCQTALPFLRRSRAATVINVASVTAHKGYPLQSLYSASKHALAGMTKSLANELYTDDIRVHLISPGGVYTEMVKISRPDLSPEGLILPEDIADIAEFFITHRTNSVIDEIETHRQNKAPFA